jgi:hypothetical protein
MHAQPRHRCSINDANDSDDSVSPLDEGANAHAEKPAIAPVG